MGDLKLKAFVHRGESVLKSVGGFNEIAGASVIMAHRLMKNSLSSPEYVLVTDEAVPDPEAPEGYTTTRHVEEVDGFGATGITVLHREGTDAGVSPDRPSWFRAKMRGLLYALKLDLYALKRAFANEPKARPKV